MDDSEANAAARAEAKSTVGWGRVTDTAECVLIIASGPSAKVIDWNKVEIDKSVTVISVNGTLPYLRRVATHWFSLDLSPFNKEVMWKEKELPIKFYAGAFPDYVRTETWVTFLRRRLGIGPRNACFGLSEDYEYISTGNSAYGALGLAYLMDAKKIALVGVDGTRGYWFNQGTPFGDLAVMQALFASAVPQLRKRGIQVLNGSKESIVDCFPHSHPWEAIDWIQG